MNPASEDKIRIIFGLKVSQHRAKLGISLSELSKRSGMSASYLNEIEKGKKYPKAEKAYALATALDLEYDELVSIKLKNDLAPLGELLASEFFDEIPFQLFGLEGGQIIELLSKSPKEASAFLGAFMEIARQYGIREKTFHTAALRSYQEISNNYFPEIEGVVAKCLQKFNLDPTQENFKDALEDVLRQQYGYEIDREALSNNALLRGVKSYYKEGKPNKLFLENNLSSSQQLFLLAKELGFNYLKLGNVERVNTIAGRVEVSGFKQLMENFSASYFAGALLLPEKALLEDLDRWLKLPQWDPEFLPGLVKKWYCTPETLFHRLTNLLPHHYGLDTLFFLKLNQEKKGGNPVLERELHLNRKHLPHANKIGAHYCGRWAAIKSLDAIFDGGKDAMTSKVQTSHFLNSADSYLVFSMARMVSELPSLATSTCLGISVNPRSKRKIQWLQDGHIESVNVNLLCETCAEENCKERKAPPTVIERRAHRAKVKKELAALH